MTLFRMMLLLLLMAESVAISWSEAILSSVRRSSSSRLMSLSMDSLFAHTVTLSCSFLNPSVPAIATM